MEDEMTTDDFKQYVYGTLADWLDGLYEASERFSLVEDHGDFQTYRYDGSEFDVEVKVTKR